MTSLQNLNKNITLSEEQALAYDFVVSFLANPTEEVIVIEGYSGTGKSTLVSYILNKLPDILSTIKLINIGYVIPEVKLTATTNKAARHLSSISGIEASTIHSELNLRVYTDYKTGETSLVPTVLNGDYSNTLLIIDEASKINWKLLKLIRKLTPGAKIIFMGDPAQLLDVKSNDAPVFNNGYPTTKLTKVMRHEGQILEVATLLRETVTTGEFPQFIPDGKSIIWLPQDEFNEKILNTFVPNMHEDLARVLVWQNNTAIWYNHSIAQHLHGTTELCAGDWVMCNSFTANGVSKISTDQSVQIESISPETNNDVTGYSVTLRNIKGQYFMPENLKIKKARLALAVAEKDYQLANLIRNSWIDLRHNYACTIDKAQGSTYKNVFVDIGDIANCNITDRKARMLYVGLSRASEIVYLTGDLT